MTETLEYDYHFMAEIVMVLLPHINRQIYGETFISIVVFFPHPHRPPFKKTI